MASEVWHERLDMTEEEVKDATLEANWRQIAREAVAQPRKTADEIEAVLNA